MEVKDEDWDLKKLCYEIKSKRYKTKTICYAESHDQALVGDKTLLMHLINEEIYTKMSKL